MCGGDDLYNGIYKWRYVQNPAIQYPMPQPVCQQLAWNRRPKPALALVTMPRYSAEILMFE